LLSKRLVAVNVVLPLIASSALFAGTGAPVIGMASSQNSFALTLDNARVSGNATLFDGSTVEANGYARVQLSNGSRLDFAAGSKGKVFSNRVSLESGMSEVQSGTGFEIDAQFLKVRPASADAVARVKVEGKMVYVTALNAPVEVLSPAGLIVARVTPGSPMEFKPQTGAQLAAFEGTGCVLEKSGAAVIVSNNGEQSVELRGADLRKFIGSEAHVTGSVDLSAKPVNGALEVVKVNASNITSKGSCPAEIIAGKKIQTPGPQAGAFIALPWLIALIIGSATAISLGAAAAAGAFNSSP
jgi:hypothetical protein